MMSNGVSPKKPNLQQVRGEIEKGAMQLMQSPKEAAEMSEELLESHSDNSIDNDHQGSPGAFQLGTMAPNTALQRQFTTILSPRRQKMLDNVVMILSHKSIKNKKEFLERYAFNKDAIANEETYELQQRQLMNTMKQLNLKKPQSRLETTRKVVEYGSADKPQKRCQSVNLRVRNLYRGIVSTPNGTQHAGVLSQNLVQSPSQIKKHMSIAVPSTSNFGGHLRSPTPEYGPQLMISPFKKPIFYVPTRPPGTSASSRMKAHLIMSKQQALLDEIEMQYKEHKKMIEERHQVLMPDVSMPSIISQGLRGSSQGYDYLDHQKSQASGSPLFSYLQSTLNQAHISHANVVKYVVNKQEDVDIHQKDILRIKNAPQSREKPNHYKGFQVQVVNPNFNIAANIPSVITVRQRRSASSIDPKVVLHDISQYEEFHQFHQDITTTKSPIKQEHRLLHRQSLDKSSDNDASLDTLKDAASARKVTASHMLHKQPPLVIEEDEYRTDVQDYTRQQDKQSPFQPQTSPQKVASQVVRTHNRRAAVQKADSQTQTPQPHPVQEEENQKSKFRLGLPTGDSANYQSSEPIPPPKFQKMTSIAPSSNSKDKYQLYLQTLTKKSASFYASRRSPAVAQQTLKLNEDIFLLPQRPISKMQAKKAQMMMRARKVSQGMTVPLSPKSGSPSRTNSPYKSWLQREIFNHEDSSRIEYPEPIIKGRRIESQFIQGESLNISNERGIPQLDYVMSYSQQMLDHDASEISLEKDLNDAGMLTPITGSRVIEYIEKTASRTIMPDGTSKRVIIPTLKKSEINLDQTPTLPQNISIKKKQKEDNTVIPANQLYQSPIKVEKQHLSPTREYSPAKLITLGDPNPPPSSKTFQHHRLPKKVPLSSCNAYSRQKFKKRTLIMQQQHGLSLQLVNGGGGAAHGLNAISTYEYQKYGRSLTGMKGGKRRSGSVEEQQNLL